MTASSLDPSAATSLRTDWPPGGARFSVVIPAHNEASVIGESLVSLGDFASQGQIVVAANGCRDETARIARGFPGVKVLEIDRPDKVAALNAAEEICSAFPRIYLDADVTLSPGALEALVEHLEQPGARAAAPEVRFDLTGCSFWVRAFYRAYRRMPYVTDGLVGLGVYALSREARTRFGAFPEVIADDLFVSNLLHEHERSVLSGHSFTVRAPRRLRDLVAVRVRTVRGNEQLAGVTPTVDPIGQGGHSRWHSLRRLLRSTAGPSAMLDTLVYAAVVIIARVRARRDTTTRWHRDESSRRAAAGPRIAYLVSQFPKLSHTFIDREIAALRDAGHQVDTFSVRACPVEELRSDYLRAAAEATRVIQDPRARAHRLSALFASGLRWAPALLPLAVGRVVRGRGGLRRRVWDLFYLAEGTLLLRWLRADGTHHVHVHFANSGADVARAAQDVARRIGYPLTWSFTMHGPTEFESPDRYDLAGKVRSAVWVACISDFCRDALLNVVPDVDPARLPVVPMGIRPEDFPLHSPPDPAVPDTAAHDEEGDRPLRILYVGRLVPEKRPGDLVAAVGRLVRDGVVVEVRIVGAGPLDSAVRDAIATQGLREVVDVVGPLAEEELPPHYAWADAFCLPSEAEGLPVVLMEAMASGLPVVTTPVAAIPELVHDGVEGFLVQPGDIKGLADALRCLASDPDAARRMGRRGHDVVLRRHDANLNAQALAQLLVPLVGTESGRAQRVTANGAPVPGRE